MVELHARYLAGGAIMFSGYGGVEFGGCGRCVRCLEREFKYSFEMLVGFGFYKVQVWCVVEVGTRCRLELYGAW